MGFLALQSYRSIDRHCVCARETLGATTRIGCTIGAHQKSVSRLQALRALSRCGYASALLATAIAWSPPRPPRINTQLREGAFPEPDFARGRQSLRGLWRLQRTCEDEGDCQDIVVNLKASGTFTATSQGDDEAMKAFAEKLNGRWYCDGDDQELRLARFERQSPVEWYTGMPAEPDRAAALRGPRHARRARTEWIGRLTPLWPETRWLPSPPLSAPNFRAEAVAGPHYLVWTTEDGATLYDVELKPDLTGVERRLRRQLGAAGGGRSRSAIDRRHARCTRRGRPSSDLCRENRAPTASG